MLATQGTAASTVAVAMKGTAVAAFNRFLAATEKYITPPPPKVLEMLVGAVLSDLYLRPMFIFGVAICSALRLLGISFRCRFSRAVVVPARCVSAAFGRADWPARRLLAAASVASRSSSAHCAWDCCAAGVGDRAHAGCCAACRDATAASDDGEGSITTKAITRSANTPTNGPFQNENDAAALAALAAA
jgi:hypothetical protein